MIGRLLALWSIAATTACYAGHETGSSDSADASGRRNDGGLVWDGGTESDSGGARGRDTGTDGDADLDPDEDGGPPAFVEMQGDCIREACNGSNLVQGRGRSGVSCYDLQDDLDVDFQIRNCGTLAADGEVQVVVRLGDSSGRDVAAGTIPPGMPPGMAFGLVLSVPWVEWRPRPDGTPVFLVIDSQDAVEECNEEDNVHEVTQLGCSF